MSLLLIIIVIVLLFGGLGGGYYGYRGGYYGGGGFGGIGLVLLIIVLVLLFGGGRFPGDELLTHARCGVSPAANEWTGELVMDAPATVLIASMRALHCPECHVGWKRVALLRMPEAAE